MSWWANSSTSWIIAKWRKLDRNDVYIKEKKKKKKKKKLNKALD